MKLKIILLFLFISSNTHSAQEVSNASLETDSICNSTNIDRYLEAKYATSLKITLEKSRKWTKNYIKAVTDKYISSLGSSDILEKYKKKFDANITVSFNNALICSFPAKIRINGDHKDHLLAPPPITSLDVKLLRGNINSSTRFKLFLPPTRGNDNEIFVTALLNSLNFISPKTYYIPTTFNDQEVTYLFQEKITKELLESYQLREGPILEGDERFLWRQDTDEGFDRLNLARLVNREWADKSLTSLNISREAVDIINKAYLEYLLGMHYYKSRNIRFLNSNFLGNQNELATKKNQEFQALLVALHAPHGLRPHNRVFYYDAMYKYFLPIYYDGSSDVLSNKIVAESDLNKDEIIGSNYALASIQNLDKNKFINQLKILGVSISQKELDKTINAIKLSLLKMSNSPYQHEVDIYKPYFSTFDEPKKQLAFSNGKIPEIISCNFPLTDCKLETLSNANYSKLLNGRYKNPDGIEYLFVGSDKLSYEHGIGENHSAKYQPQIDEIENGVQIVAYGQMDISLDRKNKVIILNQKNINGRILIVGGTLKDWTINFRGIDQDIILNQDSFNEHLLTGCLTFLDMYIENINISFNNSKCEDGVNFIRVDGSVNDIYVQNAISDAVDADFSNLDFNNVNIENAVNDCIDFSAGEYNVFSLTLVRCNDKAISVGEGTMSFFNDIQVENSNIGIAVKDSSVATVNHANFQDTAVCLSAFNKKQEFWGGKIKVNSHNCPPHKIYQTNNSIIEVQM